MRFLPDGPNIPDELLAARDEGQVIFFCGSGVSRARAGLPDFYGLAEQVVDSLGAAKKSRARAVIDAARGIRPIDGVGGLVPADRVFSLLEQEFDIELVRTKVAQALNRKKADTSAHKALVELSRGPDGPARLVTTNFDLLFEASDKLLTSHGPPDLPDPARPHKFHGIIHLHGRVGRGYAVPDEEEFVLSSADFGRAYLSDGWATRFIRALLDRYQLVFIGYAADDPPVQYLLEALGRPGLLPNNIYAFQAGSPEQARALWAHRGVEAIAYDPADGHRALWDTIMAWAERARDVEAWMRTVLDLAGASPAALTPLERGKVAHLAGSSAGARLLAQAGAKIPAEWLCVFDRHLRYAEPDRDGYEPDSPIFDPFEIWGLDQDEPPAPADPEQNSGRVAPDDAWDAFALTRRDHAELEERAPPYFFGTDAEQVARLPPRLQHLGEWLAAVAHEPAALWWAAGMRALHDSIRRLIARRLDGEPAGSDPIIRNGWRLVLDERQRRQASHRTFPLHDLSDEVKQDGWSESRVRRLAALRAPVVSVLRPYGVARPPTEADRLSSLIRIDIDYPTADVPLDVPDEWLVTYVRQLGAAIDGAAATHLRHYDSIYGLGPFTRPDPVADDDDRAEPDDLTGLLLDWLEAIDRLRKLDSACCGREIGSWLHRPEAPFVRLRLWAVGKADLLTAEQAANALLGLDDRAFWDSDHQRDLLHTLRTRWDKLAAEARKQIEARLLAGPSKEGWENAAEHEQRAAWQILQRLQWLADRGCTLSIDLDAEKRRLTEIQPRWSADLAKAADQSYEPRAYTISRDSDPASLLEVPLEALIEVARQLSGRRISERVESAPFVGLVKDHPVRALSALRRTGIKDAKWAWDAFLYAGAREADKAKLRCAIATLLSRMGAAALGSIVHSATSWFVLAADRDQGVPENVAGRLWARLLEALEARPDLATAAVLGRRSNRNWLFEAINSASGRLADLAVRQVAPNGETGEAKAVSLQRLRRLINLPEQVGHYALVLASRNLNFLFAQDPDWTAEVLLTARYGEDATRDAFWSGLVRGRNLTTELALLLRDDIVALARVPRSGRGWSQPLAGYLLSLWSRSDLRERGSALGDPQLREALLEGGEELRLQVLRSAQITMQRTDSKWGDFALRLIGQVWPRQHAARSQPVTTAIVRLVLASGDLFPAMVEASSDLVAPIAKDGQWWIDMESPRALAIAHPEAMLTFLYTILSENAHDWPYRTEPMIELLAEQARAPDPRLQELRRRLAAR